MTKQDEIDAFLTKVNRVQELVTDWKHESTDPTGEGKAASSTTPTLTRPGSGVAEGYFSYCTSCLVENLLETSACLDCGGATVPREKRIEYLKSRVAELREEKEKRRKKRDLYRKMKSSLSSDSSLTTSSPVSGEAAKVDRISHSYALWDAWEASSEDEEDQDALTDSSYLNPQFAALSRDIEERNARQAEKCEKAEEIKLKGNELLKEKKFDQAAEQYAEAIAIVPDKVELYTNRSLALIQGKRFHEAVQDCSTALKLVEFAGDDLTAAMQKLAAKALSRRAMAKRELKLYTEAIDDVQAALKHAPKDANLGKLLNFIKTDLRAAEKLRVVQKEQEISRSIVEGDACKTEQLRHQLEAALSDHDSKRAVVVMELMEGASVASLAAGGCDWIPLLLSALEVSPEVATASVQLLARIVAEVPMLTRSLIKQMEYGPAVLLKSISGGENLQSQVVSLLEEATKDEECRSLMLAHLAQWVSLSTGSEDCTSMNDCGVEEKETARRESLRIEEKEQNQLVVNGSIRVLSNLLCVESGHIGVTRHVKLIASSVCSLILTCPLELLSTTTEYASSRVVDSLTCVSNSLIHNSVRMRVWKSDQTVEAIHKAVSTLLSQPLQKMNTQVRDITIRLLVNLFHSEKEQWTRILTLETLHSVENVYRQARDVTSRENSLLLLARLATQPHVAEALVTWKLHEWMVDLVIPSSSSSIPDEISTTEAKYCIQLLGALTSSHRAANEAVVSKLIRRMGILRHLLESRGGNHPYAPTTINNLLLVIANASKEKTFCEHGGVLLPLLLDFLRSDSKSHSSNASIALARMCSIPSVKESLRASGALTLLLQKAMARS